jgi:hypothetical protein
VSKEDMAYGAQPAGTTPFFVVTHSAPQDVRLERQLGLRFTFVNDLTTAVDQARTAANDGHVDPLRPQVAGASQAAPVPPALHSHQLVMAEPGGTSPRCRSSYLSSSFVLCGG